MFRYAVTEQDYMEMTEYLMREKSRRPSSMIKLLLFTVGQMAAIAYLVFRPGDVMMILRILLAVFSLLWAGQTIFRFGFFKTRAKMALNMQKREDPTGEFWREHRLTRNGNLLTISYGAKKADIPCAQITGTKETENLTFLMSGGSIIELIPKSVTDTEEWQSFLKDLRESEKTAKRQAQESSRGKAEEEALFEAHIRMDEETLVDHIVRMKRHSYSFFTGWTPASIAIFLLPLMLASYALTEGAVLYAGVCFVIFFLMNAGQLVVFTPLYRRIVKNQLRKPAEDGYLLTVDNKGIHLFTRDDHFTFDQKEIRHVLKFQDASYYFFPNRQMLFVPAGHRDAFEKAAQCPSNMVRFPFSSKGTSS
ncbi:MAG: hypothetical protein J6I56_00085 [Lachnospiraceae bacterium]|nr:hypothetical protein [Lachnospiraceae bacterium]